MCIRDSNGMVSEVLPHFDYIVGIDIIENDTTDYCDLVLPACSNYEKWDVLVCGTKAVDQCIDPLFESKEDYEIGCMIGKLFGPEDLFSMTKEEFAAQAFDSETFKAYGIDSVETFRQAHVKMCIRDSPPCSPSAGRRTRRSRRSTTGPTCRPPTGTHASGWHGSTSIPAPPPHLLCKVYSQPAAASLQENRKMRH